ncbi:hypothetical protein EKH77_30615 [Streptomyces luteoverticillatus]|uniref:Uncharacterized protein n=1 Tax=Streptomyces luteoverticillatus TaxID=66425 RepID=A0A3S9PRA0_STRLT|nr:hypothetical protein [Streptomyces luteoverticillatus]AZQ74952.1 hypothetical protein EKH77_30615 [Streptomyces luteoverticillatus]
MGEGEEKVSVDVVAAGDAVMQEVGSAIGPAGVDESAGEGTSDGSQDLGAVGTGADFLRHIAVLSLQVVTEDN